MQSAADHVPGSRYVELRGSHFVQMEQPAAVHEELVSFVAAWERARRLAEVKPRKRTFLAAVALATLLALTACSSSDGDPDGLGTPKAEPQPTTQTGEPSSAPPRR